MLFAMLAGCNNEPVSKENKRDLASYTYSYTYYYTYYYYNYYYGYYYSYTYSYTYYYTYYYYTYYYTYYDYYDYDYDYYYYYYAKKKANQAILSIVLPSTLVPGFVISIAAFFCCTRVVIVDGKRKRQCKCQKLPVTAAAS